MIITSLFPAKGIDNIYVPWAFISLIASRAVTALKLFILVIPTLKVPERPSPELFAANISIALAIVGLIVAGVTLGIRYLLARRNV